MSSQTATSSHNQRQTSFPLAGVRISSRICRAKTPKQAWVFISGRIYWRKVANKARDAPQTILDFRANNSLHVARIQDRTATWDVVEKHVKPGQWNGKPSVVVCGKIRGPTRRKGLYVKRDVTVDLVADDEGQRDDWMKQVRARVAPWSLIEKQIKSLAGSGEVEEIRKLKEIFTNTTTPRQRNQNDQSTSPSQLKSRWERFHKYLEDRNWMKDLITHNAAAAEGIIAMKDFGEKLASATQSTTPVKGGTTIEDLTSNLEQVAEIAKFACDALKCLPGLTAVFSLVVLGARAGCKFVEAKQIRDEFPDALEKSFVMLSYVLQSLMDILIPTKESIPFQQEFVFGVLKGTVENFYIIEKELLHGPTHNYLRSKVGKEVKEKMDKLKHQVVTALNTADINKMKNNSQNAVEEFHHRRPKLSTYFAGRTKDIEKLMNLLNLYGSAVITQFGGIGKTELMTAVAERIEKEKKAPGGVFWVSVDGDKNNVISALAGLVEKLTGKELSSSDRKNGNFVVSSLWRALTNREGRWLLCLDNADNPEIDDVIDAVYRQAESSKKDGWVLVTSRSGNPKIWSRMKPEQIYALQSLPTKDAMVLMWRQVHVIDENEKSDESVMVDINQLKDSNPLEYSALEKLCGDDSAHSLGGLPLAIVQAGSYIGYEKCTFKRYLNLIRKADSKKKLAKYLEKSKEHIPLNESQRSILTTWIVSVKPLSSDAYKVLLSLAMLGPDPIPESIVTEIVEGIGDEGESVEEKYRELVMKELVHGSSLVYRKETEKGRVFAMHRLVRRFILADADRSAGNCNISINAVIQALHGRFGQLLESEGKSFRSFRDVYGYHHRECVMHAAEFIKQCESHGSASSLIDHIPKLLDIYRFTGHGLDFYGMVNEAESTWRGLRATVLKYKEMNNGACITQRDIADSLINLGNALMSVGKFEESARMLSESLEIYRAVHGADVAHFEIASSLASLGILYRHRDMFAEAESMLEQSLAMHHAIHGKDAAHTDIASLLNNLGTMYLRQGKHDDAESMYKQSLAMKRAIFGEDAVHSDIASSLNNLGRVYFMQGKYDDAESMYKQSLAMLRAIHVKDAAHTDIAMSLNNLGLVCEAQEKLDKAESNFVQCLVMFRALFGVDSAHSHVLQALKHLGRIYEKQEKREKAKKVFEEARVLVSSSLLQYIQQQ